MPQDLESRRKKVNLEAMDADTAENAGFETGKKIEKILENSTNLINGILKIYGLKSRLNYVLVDDKGESIPEYNSIMSDARKT